MKRQLKSLMTHRLLAALAAGSLLLFCFSVGTLKGQVASSGAITGVVADQSGAVAPEVAVQVKNIATGETRSVLTGSEGRFNFPFLSPGTYTLTAKKSGFKTAIFNELIVQVNAILRSDVQLELGQVTQEVSVTAAPQSVNTEDATLGNVVGPKTIVTLPLNGRHFLQLGTLIPGVYAPSPRADETTGLTGGRAGLQLGVGGTHQGSVDFLFDGIPSKHDFYNAVGIEPPPDAIAEFKIQTGYFSPQYGLPGVVNVVLKSGSNAFHGGLWEFIRNDALDARNAFDFTVPPLKQNQFGGDLGGRILRDKLFFFGDYEALRVRSGSGTATAIVPTTQMLSGDFSGLPTIYDPATYDPGTGLSQPFTNNMIPSNRISDFAKNFNQFIPAPNSAPLAQFAGANLIGSNRNLRNDNKFDAKIDFAPSEKDRFFGRFTWLNSSVSGTTLLPGAAASTPFQSRNAVLSWTHIFGPTLVNEARAGLDRVFLDTNRPANASGPDWPTSLGLMNLNTIPDCNAVPAVGITDFSTFGFAFGNCIVSRNTNKIYLDNLAWTIGHHSLTLGGQVIRMNLRDIASFTQNGSLSFDGRFTGNPVADYLLGDPYSVSGQKPTAPSYLRAWWPDLYINDNYHVTKKLTLNLGLRWQYNQPFSEKNNRLSYFDFSTGQTFVQGETGYKPLTSHKKDFAPRFGIAYSPSENWVLRGSFGIFWDRTAGNELIWQNVGPPFTVGYSAVSDPNVPTISIPGLFPTFTPNLVGASLFTFVDRGDPYMQQWTVSVQHTFPFQVLAEVAYYGSQGVHLSMRQDMNTAGIPGGSRPYPDYGFIAADLGLGTMRYNALEVSVRKAYSHGLNFTSAYTYANSIAGGGNGGDWGAFNYSWTHIDQGLSVVNMRHNWVSSVNYDLPVGKGLPGPAKLVVGGWNVGGILTFHSGYPFQVGNRTDLGNIRRTFGNGYPNRTCNGNLSNQTLQMWFDTTCFVAQPANSFGNAGINYLWGPGVANADLDVHKNFPFGEDRLVEFRAEFFSAFNHPQFGFPRSTLGSPGFGQISGAGGGRIIQFGLKVLW
jgi:Carboxypeptidase regulatory-like domain